MFLIFVPTCWILFKDIVLIEVYPYVPTLLYEKFGHNFRGFVQFKCKKKKREKLWIEFTKQMFVNCKKNKFTKLEGYVHLSKGNFMFSV